MMIPTIIERMNIIIDCSNIDNDNNINNNNIKR